MTVLEWTTDWAEAECRWISQFKAQGCHLVNGNAGGVTMHQARIPAKYPAIKRAYRILEGAARVARRMGDDAALFRSAARIAAFKEAVQRLRQQGRLHLAEARFSDLVARG